MCCIPHVYIYKPHNTQATARCSGTNGLLTSDFGSSTRGERHNSLKSFVSDYAENTPNVRHILWCLFSIHHCWSEPEKLNRRRTSIAENSIICPNCRNSIVCLHGPISNPQLPGRTQTFQHHGRTPASQHHGRNSTESFSKIFLILRTISSRHDDIHTSAPFPVWGFIMAMVIVICFARVHNCTNWLHNWTFSPNSSKPNQTEW